MGEYGPAITLVDRLIAHACAMTASAWRSSLPETRGPWLLVGEAIASAAGGLVVNDTLDDKAFQLLVGPWRQAIGTMTPVRPGPVPERIGRR